MKGAARLWWILRGSPAAALGRSTTLTFALLTWTVLTAVVLGRLATTSGPDGVVLGAMAALLGALALTALVAVHSLFTRTDPRRLQILRGVGATRPQTGLVCLLEVGEAALPGVASGVLGHLALALLAGRAGVDLSVDAVTLATTAGVLAAAVGVVVAARVRSSSRSALD